MLPGSLPANFAQLKPITRDTQSYYKIKLSSRWKRKLKKQLINKLKMKATKGCAYMLLLHRLSEAATLLRTIKTFSPEEGGHGVI